MMQLLLDDVEIPLTMGSYREYPRVKEERNETEAGTVHRNIVRSGIAHLEVSTTVDDTVKAYLDSIVCEGSATAEYFSESTGTVETKTMFLDPDSYEADLVMENGENRFYNVSFTLEEF